MPLQILRNDITKMRVDAIVNAANSSLLGGGGVDGAIHRAAGPALLEECRAIRAREGGCRTGDAKMTGAGRLPCRYVIHTVGPVWQGGRQGEAELLASCYRRSLDLAAEKGCETVAFPLISAGAYGYPKQEALRIAVDTIRAWLQASGPEEMAVSLVVFDKAAFEVSSGQYAAVAAYIDDHYVEAHAEPASMAVARKNRALQNLLKGTGRGGKKHALFGLDAAPDAEIAEDAVPPAVAPPPAVPGMAGGPGKPPAPPAAAAAPREANIAPQAIPAAPFAPAAPQAAPAAPFAPAAPQAAPASLREALRSLDESFAEMLLRKIDERGITDAACYKKANISRKLFSKIRADRLYRPSKPTALAFALSLELGLDETQELLRKAGFALSHSSKFDVIVEYFILNGVYDVMRVNEALFAFDQPLLGSI